MKLKTGDFYYGAVLAQIASYPALSHVSSIAGKEGYFQINDDKRLLIKYSTADQGAWRFTIRPGDLSDLDANPDYRGWLALMCGQETICILNEDDLRSIVASESTASQWISVECNNGGSMRVSGSLGNLKRRIRHNAFPCELFTNGGEHNEFSWPPLCRLQFYTVWPHVTRTTEDPFFDLSDSLGWNIGHGQTKIIYMGVRTYSPDWPVWDKTALAKIERTITYDLNFDGFDVAIERISPVFTIQTRKRVLQRCSNEFLWKLTIGMMP